MSQGFWPFLARHCLVGMIAGWLTVAGLLWLDVAGLATLVFGSDLFPVPLAMLLAFFSLTFASVAMGAAIMGLGRDDAGAGDSSRASGPGSLPASRSMPRASFLTPVRGRARSAAQAGTLRPRAVADLMRDRCRDARS